MNKEDIIRMAREAGFDTDLPPFQDGTAIALKLAALVASAEREACAKVCEEGIATAEDWDSAHWDQACENRAWAIRARGQA